MAEAPGLDRVFIDTCELFPFPQKHAFLTAEFGGSRLRNPAIARVFKEIGLMEEWCTA